MSKQYDFTYPKDKLLELAKRIKTIVDDKAKYPAWNEREDIKAELKVSIIVLLDEFGYPPTTNDDVYKSVIAQAISFKENQLIASVSE